MSCLALQNKSREWERKIQEQKQSGLSVARWCQQHQVSYNTFIYWKRRFVRVSSLDRKSFIELPENSSKSGIQLECNGIHVHLNKDFDTLTLARCLQTLKRTPC